MPEVQALKGARAAPSPHEFMQGVGQRQNLILGHAPGRFDQLPAQSLDLHIGEVGRPVMMWTSHRGAQMPDPLKRVRRRRVPFARIRSLFESMQAEKSHIT